MAFFDIYDGALGEIPVPIFRQQPLFSNVPSWLTDVKHRVLEKIHNSEDTGHGGEQRTYALAHKLYPTMEITRSDVREFIRYCHYCQKQNQRDKFDVPHASIADPMLNMMIADL